VIAQPEMLLSNSKHRKTEIIGFGVILISWYADSHSENWPTCQIIDSWSCVEVYCQESDFDHHVNFLQLLYVVIDGSLGGLWHGVKNALGILHLAVDFFKLLLLV
jgi:hypothetical protein